MASGLSCVVLLCAILVPCAFGWDDGCLSYTDSDGEYHQSRLCGLGFCCGTCTNRYCCRDTFKRLDEDSQETCDYHSYSSYSSPLPMVLGIVGFIVTLLISICCCVCPCCCMYNLCHKRQPVIATTTHTTVVTNTPQRYPQQPTAAHPPPHPYQGAQYPAYQPVPVQPGYGSQPMPQGYGSQPMPALPYQAQPFAPGPPPTYVEATGPAYPPNPMPYSQAAFSPDQPSYPLQPPVHPQANAPPSTSDFLAQPAYNPAFVGPPPKTG